MYASVTTTRNKVQGERGMAYSSKLTYLVDNLLIPVNLFGPLPLDGEVEQPIEVQTNLVFFAILVILSINFPFSTPVIKSAAKCELSILSIQFDSKTATRVE